MDREIIFRGKTKDGRWMYGDLARRLVETKWQDILGKYQFAIAGKGEREKTVDFKNKRAEVIKCVTVDPETVGQFTGLCDKNGKKIFEGDVVFVGYGEYYQGTHEYSTTITVDMSNYDALNALCNANVVEVIGNIHDNPELVEEIE